MFFTSVQALLKKASKYFVLRSQSLPESSLWGAEPEPEPSLLPDIMEPDPGFRAPQFGLGD